MIRIVKKFTNATSGIETKKPAILCFFEILRMIGANAKVVDQKKEIIKQYSLYVF